MNRTGLGEFGDVERGVLSGDQLLWLAWGESVEAAATTHLIKTDAKPVCVITACSGNDRERWLPLLAQIEEYARNEGAQAMRIYGRAGWQRVLQGYEKTHVILEKAL